MPTPVLLFDGECGLCQRTVRLLLRFDRQARLRYAALQSPPAQRYLRAHGLPTADFDSMVFVPDWDDPLGSAPVLRSTGALAALAALGGIWRTAEWLRLIPAPLRDALYRLVARTRYALFGPWHARPLARPEWQERFLH